VLSKKIGIDIGTSNLLIYVQGTGIVVREPSLVALDQAGTRILAVGRRAFEMVGVAPPTVRFVRPIREGAIADLVATEGLLMHFIAKVQGRQRIFRPEIMICVPAAVTGHERRALIEVAMAGGARQAWLIDATLAAAMGAGLPIAEARAHAVCDIGAGSSEMAVIARSGRVVEQSVRGGGNGMDLAITDHLRRHHDLLVESGEAEASKLEAGAAVALDVPRQARVRGSDVGTGRPRTVEIGSEELTEAIQEPLQAIAAGLREVLNQTPPGLAADIRERGLVLTGGGAGLRGLDRYLSGQIGIPTLVANDAPTCVVRGTGQALAHFPALQRKQLYLR